MVEFPDTKGNVFAVWVPNELLHVPGLTVLYLNHAEVSEPFGLYVPFNVAEVAATLVGEVVVTVGGTGAPEHKPKQFESL